MLNLKSLNDKSYCPCLDDYCDWENTHHCYRGQSVFSMIAWYYFEDVFQDDLVLVDQNYIAEQKDNSFITFIFDRQAVIISLFDNIIVI